MMDGDTTKTLAAGQASPRQVFLRPLQQAEFPPLQHALALEQAEGFARLRGVGAEQLLDFYHRATQTQIAQALATPGHSFLAITDASLGMAVGSLWLNEMREEGQGRAWYLNWIGVRPEYQRQGYGRAALLALGDELTRLGGGRLVLQVFHANEAALGLYRALAFEPTRLYLHKRY
jgi:ribosomal protein S18 acetylase RimI-like enzyme